MKQKIILKLFVIMCFPMAIWLISSSWCQWNAPRWYSGNKELNGKFVKGIEKVIMNDLSRKDFQTGNSQFNGEWLFGTYMMTGLGLAQTASEHPELKTKNLELIEICIQQILSPPVRDFDKESWGSDPIESLETNEGHIGYLGYFNLLLSYHRLLDPHSRYAELNDKITAALVRRMEQSPILLLKTYPDELYPMDNCSVIGSLGLYDRATGKDHSALIQKWIANCKNKYQDKQTGLLYQAVDVSGEPVDAPRGSGTALGLYFLSFADAQYSWELFQAVKRELAWNAVGFGMVNEYPKTVKNEGGDIDSGPVLFGVGLSATGFTISGARIHGDETLYQNIFGTAHLFGAPLEKSESFQFVTGGPIGNAIMFAMLTAQPSSLSKKP